jgi:hypothetical protein
MNIKTLFLTTALLTSVTLTPALAVPTGVYSQTQFFGFFRPRPEWDKRKHKNNKQHHAKVRLETSATTLSGATVSGDNQKLLRR